MQATLVLWVIWVESINLIRCASSLLVNHSLVVPLLIIFFSPAARAGIDVDEIGRLKRLTRDMDRDALDDAEVRMCLGQCWD